MKLTELPEPVNAMYYGDGGTGKTTSLAMMAKLGPVKLINAEGGVKARALKRMGVPIDNIDVWPEPGTVITYDGLEQLHEQMLSDLQDDPESWAGVAWDSVTEIHQALLLEVRHDAIARAERNGKELDPFHNDISYYGTMTEKMRMLIRRFRDLPCHFGISALERRDQDDDGAVKYGPAATPALANDLFGYVDVVIHTTVGTIEGVEEFRGHTRPYAKYRAKDRLSVLPRVFIDPTFDRLVAYADDELVPKEDPVMVAAQERRQAAKEKEEAKGE